MPVGNASRDRVGRSRGSTRKPDRLRSGVLFYFVRPSRGKVGVVFAFLLVVYFASHRLWPDPASRLQSRRRR